MKKGLIFAKKIINENWNDCKSTILDNFDLEYYHQEVIDIIQAAIDIMD